MTIYECCNCHRIVTVEDGKDERKEILCESCIWAEEDYPPLDEAGITESERGQLI
jgi:hypothetical protein